MNVAQGLAAYLRALGVRRAFGVPGGELVELIEALRRQDIRFILTHHEAPAAFMAAATGELSGAPGVCLATRGPGAVNLFAGVATAFLDRRPVLAITGAHGSGSGPAARDTHQNLPLLELYRPITRLAEQLTADNAAELVPRAAAVAAGPRPGPVYLPLSAAEATRPLAEVDWRSQVSRAASPSAGLTSEARQRLATSWRPLLLGGIGLAATPGLASSLEQLAERWGCPLMVTSQVKGYAAEDDPLFAGTFGMYRDEPLQRLLDQADLIVALGLDGVDFFKRWTTPTLVLSLAPEGADDPAVQPRLAIDGALPELLLELRHARAAGSDWPAEAAAQARAEIAEIVRPKLASAPDGDGELMPPQTAIEELRRLLPRDGICTVDVGSHKIVVVQQWRAFAPQTFICSNGLSPMGTGLPFAIAARLERPDQEVVCICGDGGLLMYAGELATMRRLGLKITILLMADQALSSIKVKQVRQDYPPTGVEFSRPDWDALARGYGLQYARVGRRSDCAEALAHALAGSEPTLVEARIDPEEYNTTQ